MAMQAPPATQQTDRLTTPQTIQCLESEVLEAVLERDLTAEGEFVLALRTHSKISLLAKKLEALLAQQADPFRKAIAERLATLYS